MKKTWNQDMLYRTYNNNMEAWIIFMTVNMEMD